MEQLRLQQPSCIKALLSSFDGARDTLAKRLINGMFKRTQEEAGKTCSSDQPGILGVCKQKALSQ
jgi:hypothetical protein